MSPRLPAGALERLFRPRRTALVGASDKNLFSRRAFAQQRRVGRGEQMALVNARSPEVHGVATVARCQDIEGGIDCAYVMTAQAATEEVLTDAAAAGARAAVILSQGWAEAGPEGRARQEACVARARELGMVLLGPNHLGFANLRDGVAACALGLDLPTEPGGLALISQSGALGSAMTSYAARHDVRFSHVVTTGNEAMVTVADVLHFVLDDPGTRAVGIFAETLREPALFRAGLERAAALGKAVVVLKAGASERAARTAEAHTGALVGDDHVVDAALRQDGAIRVRTLEDLVITGNLCAGIGPLARDGVAVLSISGGACDLVADRGEDEGLPLADLTDDTLARLAAELPDYGHAQNPLDLTGAALADPGVWTRALEVLGSDPGVGLVGLVSGLPTESGASAATGGRPETGRSAAFDAIGAGLRAAGLPGVLCPQMDTDQTPFSVAAKRAAGFEHVVPGVDRLVVAAAGLARWSRWRRSRRDPVGAPAVAALAPPALPCDEHAAAGLLRAAGVPVVPATLARTVDEAVAAAAGTPGPVVLKLCSAHVAHKTEVGGVELGLAGDDEVAAGYRRIVERARGVERSGVLVAPQRSGGVELLVGVVRDAGWGPVLAVGAGGRLVELLDDSALRLLPVDPAEIRGMLELRVGRLLAGHRGAAPADLDRVTDAIARIAALAVALGPEVASVEVNPLWVDGARVEALDVLITGNST